MRRWHRYSATLPPADLATSAFSWESNPALTEVEEVMCDWMRQLCGLSDQWFLERFKTPHQRPCCVVASLGSTGVTAFDPLPAIADVCERYSIWLHADAAMSGAAMMLPERRSMFEGIRRINSSGQAFCSPSLLDGRWTVRVSIGVESTERSDIQFLWDLFRHEVRPPRYL
jgi:hypothetical protein